MVSARCRHQSLFYVGFGLLLGLLGSPAAAQAQVITYSNSAAFNSALVSGFTANFNSLPFPDQPVVSPTNFAGNGFAFSAITTSNQLDSSLYSIGPSSSDRWLSLFWPDDFIVLTNFSANIRAVGGNFFGTDQNGSPESSSISLTATFIGAPTFTTNIQAAGPANFFGLTFESQVSSLRIGGAPSYATLDNVTVGTVVPEPATVSLLALAVGILLFVAFRRSRSRHCLNR
jgi:hypothetical protein